jgi:hypothetical protein
MLQVSVAGDSTRKRKIVEVLFEPSSEDDKNDTQKDVDFKPIKETFISSTALSSPSPTTAIVIAKETPGWLTYNHSFKLRTN